jgi:phosphatidylserine/phosphatidylglycerophosphate/cardiolipin synthase-like enzyme
VRRVLAVIVVLALVPLGAGASPPAEPAIVGVYPDPVVHGDDGEFVVLAVPDGANRSLYRLTDGESTVEVPDTDPGRVTLAFRGTRPAELDGRDPIAMGEGLRLANAGEVLRLRRNGTVVDELRYGDTREGHLLVSTGESDQWRALGATDRSIISGGPGSVRAFVLPDAGELPVQELRRAEKRIRLAGYTLASEGVTDALIRAHRRNVSVSVLVDAEPVGGMSRRQVQRLNALARAGIEVRAIGGPRARYRFHHAKYAVIDDRALVTTENWKPSGTGGHSNRGWGVLTNQSAIVEGLAETFAADTGWTDARPWRVVRADVEAVEAPVATGRFPERHAPTSVPVARTELVLAPETAEGRVRRLLGNATESIWIEQPSVGGLRQPFVNASIAAARRGVTVRFLLGSAWYNEEENRRIAERLRTIEDREDLDLAVRLANPRGRFDSIHAKGVVVDGDRVLLGSLNWNNNSARHNREVALVLHGEAVGAYYQSVIRGDWEGGATRLLIGIALAVLIAAVGAGLVARRIRFEGARDSAEAVRP